MNALATRAVDDIGIGARQARILRLITRLNVGGPGRHALLLARGLADEFRTTLAAGVSPDHEGELSDPDVPVRRVPLVRPPRPRADAAALRAVRRLLRDARIDLVHTHMAKAGAVGRVAARTLVDRPRTVHTYHGHVFDGYFAPAARRAVLEAERRLARVTDVLVAVSAEVRDQLLDLGVGSPAQYEVVPLGLDLSRHLAVDRLAGRFRRELGLRDEPLVCVVARLTPIKEHATLIDAMHLLPGVHLAVVGDGELRAQLEARCRLEDLAGRVHFAGWRHDVPDTLADVDVVALASRSEGTPLSLIEALACGRPVVATDVGGVRAVVADGVSGRLVAPGRPSELAAAIGELLADRGRRSRMGAAGRRHVRARFGHDRLLADMRGLYRELLARSH